MKTAPRRGNAKVLTVQLSAPARCQLTCLGQVLPWIRWASERKLRRRGPKRSSLEVCSSAFAMRCSVLMQVVPLPGDLDVYMNVLRHLGLGGQLPPSPIAAAPAAAAPVSPKPQAQAAPVAKPAAQPVAQAKPAAAASPKAAAKAVPAAKVVTKKTGGAVEEDERLLAAATGREDASALSLSASQRIDHNDPNQIAALAAAQNLISHGIGNASTDEQVRSAICARCRRTLTRVLSSACSLNQNTDKYPSHIYALTQHTSIADGRVRIRGRSRSGTCRSTPGTTGRGLRSSTTSSSSTRSSSQPTSGAGRRMRCKET